MTLSLSFFKDYFMDNISTNVTDAYSSVRSRHQSKTEEKALARTNKLVGLSYKTVKILTSAESEANALKLSSDDFQRGRRSTCEVVCAGAKETAKNLCKFSIIQPAIDFHTHLTLPKDLCARAMAQASNAHLDSIDKKATDNFYPFSMKSYILVINEKIIGPFLDEDGKLTVLDMPSNQYEYMQGQCTKLITGLILNPEVVAITELKEFFRNLGHINFRSASDFRAVATALNTSYIPTPDTLMLKTILALQKKNNPDILSQLLQDAKSMAFYYKTLASSTLFVQSQQYPCEMNNTKSFKEAFSIQINKISQFLLTKIPPLYVGILITILLEREISGEEKKVVFKHEISKPEYNLTASAQENLTGFASNLFKAEHVEHIGFKVGNVVTTSGALILYITGCLQLLLSQTDNKNNSVLLAGLLKDYMRTLQEKDSKQKTMNANLLTARTQSQEDRGLVSDEFQNENLAIDTDGENVAELTVKSENIALQLEDEKTISSESILSLLDVKNINEPTSSDIQRQKQDSSITVTQEPNIGVKTSCLAKISHVSRVTAVISIAIRAIANGAFEVKDATPDKPARDFVYNNIFSKLLVPASLIENAGIKDEMLSRYEVLLQERCVIKSITGEALTDDEADFSAFMEGRPSKHKSNMNKSRCFTLINNVAALAFMAGDITYSTIKPEHAESLWKTKLFDFLPAGFHLLNTYKVIVRPLSAIINLVQVMRIVKNPSKYDIEAFVHITARLTTAAIPLIMWQYGNTLNDTIAALIDTAITVGTDAAAGRALNKAKLEGLLENACNLLVLMSYSTPPESKQDLGDYFDKLFYECTLRLEYYVKKNEEEESRATMNIGGDVLIPKQVKKQTQQKSDAFEMLRHIDSDSDL